jgi:hypothetical protein
MEFNSMKEYFFKLRNALYFTLLIPLILFIGILYLYVGQWAIDVKQSLLLESFLLFLMIADWLIGLLFFRTRLKKIRRQVGLGIKLEQYYWLTIVRSWINILACLFPAIGFLLTSNFMLAYIFGFDLVLVFIFWPRARKVCHDLKLKGDEREMVLYKKDSF